MSDDELTVDQKKSLLRDHLSEVKRLSAEVAEAEGNTGPTDFGVDAPPATGEMHTASNSPIAQQALQSLEAAERELGVANAVALVIDRIVSVFGLR